MNVIAMLVPIIFVGLWLAVWTAWKWRERNKSSILQERGRFWPTVTGVLTSKKLVWAHVEITYEYATPNGTHQGIHKIQLSVVLPDRTGQDASKLNDEAKAIMEKFAVGQNLTVRYNPTCPDQSILVMEMA
jgi:hypothetical protein